MLLPLRRVYLYWKYEFLSKCCMCFIKRIHSPAGKFLNFRINKSKLRIVLIKVCFEMFYKHKYFLKMLRKICKNYLWKNSLKVTNFQPRILQKKTPLLWVYNKDFIDVLKLCLLSALATFEYSHVQPCWYKDCPLNSWMSWVGSTEVWFYLKKPLSKK